ncbi:MAG TPA: ABC transporter permease [Candidatus Angelobacter sp.]|jgi:predicted permease|nr:ABC transporter permease [Candidatus Angelobacter sp.]
MGTFLQDLRYALRMLRKSPAFTAVAVITLALGIGANTAIFSLENAVMLKMLPVKNPGELVVVGDPTEVHGRHMGDPQVNEFSYPLYRDIRDGSSVFTGMLASGEAHRQRVTGDSIGEISGNATGVLVSGNYFSVLGVNALYGRVITPDDDSAPGAHPVLVVSYGFWKNKLGESPSIVGQTLRINNYPFTVIGVAPPGFYGDTVGDAQDFWAPVTMQEQLINGRKWMEDYNASWLHVIARLKPGVTVEKAAANVNLILQQLVNGPLKAKLEKDDLANLKADKVPVSAGGGGFSDLRGDFQQPLLLLMIIVALVLVIACVNVANLLLARASSRRKEFAVRVAIGAAPGRIVRQLLTESILLAFAGGALGVLLARWGTYALLKLSGNDDLEASPDLRVFLFTAAVCILTGVLFGLIPALRSRRVAVALTLKSGSQNGSSANSGWNWGKLLVTGQVAVSLLVLFVAGLLVHSLQNMRNVDLGYNREHLLLLSTDPLAAGYNNNARIGSFANQLAEQISSLPGVRAVTSSKNGLFSGSESGNSIKVEGYTSKNDPDLQAAFDEVAPNYFRGVGIPMLLGRDIGLQDTETSPRVAVINETMARFYFGQTNPIGRKFIVEDPGSKGPVEIVGVARDARDHKLKGKVDRRFYVPLSQSMGQIPVVNFVVRTVGNPVAVAEAVRKQLKNLDANIPVNNIRSLNELTERAIGDHVLIARLSSFFAGLALLLAAIGLYGILSYSVAGRTREIGVRMALGAQRGSVLKMILQEAGRLVLLGIVIGIPSALLASRLFSSMLFGLKGTDPVSMLLVIAVLLAIALLASYIPARRATKVDPMVALRYE